MWHMWYCHFFKIQNKSRHLSASGKIVRRGWATWSGAPSIGEWQSCAPWPSDAIRCAIYRRVAGRGQSVCAKVRARCRAARHVKHLNFKASDVCTFRWSAICARYSVEASRAVQRSAIQVQIKYPKFLKYLFKKIHFIYAARRRLLRRLVVVRRRCIPNPSLRLVQMKHRV